MENLATCPHCDNQQEKHYLRCQKCHWEMDEPNRRRCGRSWCKQCGGGEDAHTFAWWKVDKEEIKKEAEQYNTIHVSGSSRGVAIALIALSTLITTGYVLWSGPSSYAFIEIGVFLFLGIFIYRGHRWAIILAMILWTLGKGRAFAEAITAQPVGIGAISSIFWWALYMRVFYKAYLVEKLRKKK